MIEISMQARPKDPDHWRRLAQAVESGGFDTLYVADHPGTLPAPFVALAAAAPITTRVRLGTCVANAGRWDPLVLANEVATLDVLSGGRAVLGLGAGHTPSEWTSVGQAVPSPGERVGRLAETSGAVRQLLAGERVSMAGSYVTLCEAQLAVEPVQAAVPIMIGGNGRRLLGFAAERADIVGITGTTRTLADGHTHAVRWGKEALDEVVGHVRDVAAAFHRSPKLEVLVQHVELSDDPRSRAEALSTRTAGAAPGDLLGSPFVWLGTPDEIVQSLDDAEERWGITRYVVREPALEAARTIVRLLQENRW